MARNGAVASQIDFVGDGRLTKWVGIIEVSRQRFWCGEGGCGDRKRCSDGEYQKKQCQSTGQPTAESAQMPETELDEEDKSA